MLTLNTEMITIETLIGDIFKIRGSKKFSASLTNGLDFVLNAHFKIGSASFSITKIDNEVYKIVFYQIL